MTEGQSNAANRSRSRFVRFGGFAILFAFLIHIVVNAVLKEFPPDDPTLDQLKAYLSEQASTWAVVHGLRYVAFVGIAFFAAALFMKTCRAGDPRSIGWGLVGLLGAALHIANGIITNGIEVLAFMDFRQLSEDPKLFRLLFQLTRILFTGEIVAWGLVIGGFSVAGWQSATLPRWLSILGFLGAIGSLACGIFIVSIMSDGRATPLVQFVPLACLAWFLITGALLACKGAGEVQHAAV